MKVKMLIGFLAVTLLVLGQSLYTERQSLTIILRGILSYPLLTERVALDSIARYGMKTTQIATDTLGGKSADRIYVEDTIIFAGGTVIKPNGILLGAGDSLVGTDATRADSFMFKHDGSNVDFFSDDGISFSPNGGATYFCNYLGYYPNDDTLRTSGKYDKRHKESHALRQCWSSPDKVDSGKIFDNGDSTMFQTDNARVRFNGCVLADTVRPKDLRPQMVMWEGHINYANITTINNAGTTFYSAPFSTSRDSIVIDSILFVFYSSAEQDSVDSMRLYRGYTRATDDGTLLFRDPANYGKSSSGYFTVAIATASTVISPDWRPKLTIWSKNPMTNLYMGHILFVGHYK